MSDIKTYIKVTVNGTSYILMSLDDTSNAAPGQINELLQMIFDPEYVPLTISHVQMSEEEFAALPEFNGF